MNDRNSVAVLEEFRKVTKEISKCEEHLKQLNVDAAIIEKKKIKFLESQQTQFGLLMKCILFYLNQCKILIPLKTSMKLKINEWCFLKP